MLFKISKGNHYSNQFIYKAINFINKGEFIGFTVRFNDSCRYQLPKEDQEDINKLFGFSLGFNHHCDSARFGWFYKNEKINLYSYMYDNTKRFYEFITELELNKNYSLSLFSFDKEWKFSVANDEEELAIKKYKRSKEFSIGYKLWPYFGGNNPAPHDIEIVMIKD